MSTSPKKEKPAKIRKHVSSACLECRKRHFKCDGKQPVCERCQKSNRTCQYVASHRGGSRKKGVFTKKKPVTINDVNLGPEIPMYVADIEDFGKAKPEQSVEVPVIKTNEDMYGHLMHLPCATDSKRCEGSNCPAKSAVTYAQSRQDKHGPLNDSESKMMEGLRKRIKLESTMSNINCLFSDNNPPIDIRSFKELEMTTNIHDTNNFVDFSTLDRNEIIKNYYEKFHKAHPFLPPREEMLIYLSNESIASELLPILNIVSEGETSSIYARNIDLISDRLVQCVEVVKNNGVIDIISLQVLVLVSLIAHVSSVHVLSKNLRFFCIYLVQDLQIHLIDAPSNSDTSDMTPNSDSNPQLRVFTSPRLSHISRDSVVQCARRLFWELQFVDIITGSADGKTISSFDTIESQVEFPTVPSREEFDYHGRSEAGSLVTNAVKMNNEIYNKRPYEVILKRLKASLSSWEMRLEDPSLFEAPPLIGKNGKVNEGVQQAILLFNYAKIFAHRPFSYLWKINSPQHPKCNGEAIESKDLSTQMQPNSRTTIETRKTIEGANSIIQVLIDTGASKILERTHFFACALALSSLVHLSAYIWVETTLSMDSTQNFGLSEEDLEVYTEYIKLSLSAIYPISKHWILSGKLAKHIRDSLTTLRPKLYSKLKDFLPQLEIAVGNMKISRSKTPEDSSTRSSALPLNPVSTVSTVENTQQTPIQQYQQNLHSNQQGTLDMHDNTVNNLLNDHYDFGNLSWEPVSPVSPSGCDWIDKGFMDFNFDQFPTSL
ncbi:iacK C6 finger domain transcription factor iacK [Candida maltosa Xu316]